jgi:phosphoribosylaminoimidazole (AIR) synthetase
MVRTFNLGIGLTFVVRDSLADAALAAVPEAVRLGSVVPSVGGAPRVRFD